MCWLIALTAGLGPLGGALATALLSSLAGPLHEATAAPHTIDPH